MTPNAWKYWFSVLGGIAVIVIFPIFTFASLFLYPTAYSPAVNWLSDLGSFLLSPRGAIIYDLGCIFTGSALVLFFCGMSIWNLDDPRKKVIFFVIEGFGLLEGFSLVMIGVFSEDTPDMHNLWSDIFFFANMVVQVLASVALLFHQMYFKGISVYGFVTSGINIIFVITLGNSPALEWLTVFTALVFAGLIVLNTAVKFKKGTHIY
ncbi:MAG TPA: hypothetical protein VKM55_15670 [Candidatus Lokiarchaeia archaeon]|nr:hypothetical protein [Candidatus Lokiarchaeia archaeon]